MMTKKEMLEKIRKDTFERHIQIIYESKYIFGIKTKSNKIFVYVTPKGNWFAKSEYVNNISLDLQNTMEYFGFEKSNNGWEFVSESKNKTIDEIITLLNKSPILEYNDNFNEFVLSYVYCVKEDASEDDSDLALYITPMLYWLNEKCQSDKETDEYILKDLYSLKLDEVGANIFVLDNEDKHYTTTTFMEKLNESKYLKYNKDFDKFIC